jgi:hypothetical protein
MKRYGIILATLAALAMVFTATFAYAGSKACTKKCKPVKTFHKEMEVEKKITAVKCVPVKKKVSVWAPVIEKKKITVMKEVEVKEKVCVMKPVKCGTDPCGKTVMKPVYKTVTKKVKKPVCVIKKVATFKCVDKKKCSWVQKPVTMTKKVKVKVPCTKIGCQVTCEDPPVVEDEIVKACPKACFPADPCTLCKRTKK